ncbi:MAG: universal stress protein [Bacteroidota bacterium]
MKPIQKILITTDFSSTAHNALIYALDLAEMVEAEVFILHAWRMPVDAATPYSHDHYLTLEKESEAKMQQLRHDFLYAPKVPYECLVKSGNPVDLIEEIAREKQADLIIMGTRRAEGAKTWFGSITTHAVKRSSFPVLVVPEEARFTRPKTIVLATTPEKVIQLTELHLVKALASTFGASINILHIHPTDQEHPVEQQKLQEALDHYLEGITHHFSTARGDKPGEAIETFIQQHEADILVMLPEPYNLLDRLRHGSTTKQMIFHATQPLLVAK